MIEIHRLEQPSKDFVALINELDKGLAITDGSEHEFYDQYNGLNDINHFVVAYLDSKPVGCGAFKPFNDSTIEIKRMFTQHQQRGNGIATKVLIELEKWAKLEGYRESVLETGKRQIEAIQLYQKHGYRETDNYGQYANASNSLCFKKSIE